MRVPDLTLSDKMNVIGAGLTDIKKKTVKIKERMTTHNITVDFIVEADSTEEAVDLVKLVTEVLPFEIKQVVITSELGTELGVLSEPFDAPSPNKGTN